MFSPYYAWARRRGAADPFNHCALNVALYGAGGKRWAMTERGRARVSRTQHTLAIGPSALNWDGTSLTIEIAETTAPIPSRIRGTVRVIPSALTGRRFDLDAEGRHRWSPLAPTARVEVALRSPGLRWSGPGYLDANDGDAPLEASFRHWAWSRAKPRAGTVVLYEGQRLTGPFSLALRFSPDGACQDVAPPPPVALPPTLWRMPRPTRADPGVAPRLVRTLEDAPFYARSVFEAEMLGEPVTVLHESLSLRRFGNPVVQAMLPFRAPRWA